MPIHYMRGRLHDNQVKYEKGVEDGTTYDLLQSVRDVCDRLPVELRSDMSDEQQRTAIRDAIHEAFADANLELVVAINHSKPNGRYWDPETARWFAHPRFEHNTDGDALTYYDSGSEEYTTCDISVAKP